MDDRPAFTMAVSQNKFLSQEDTELDAVITVSAHGLSGALGGGRAPEAAEVIAIDCSGSMMQPWTKFRSARQATMAAIDGLRDGVWFAVIEGTHLARSVYPTDRPLAQVSPQTKDAAKVAVKHLVADGGTAMGSWLRLAGELLDDKPAAVRHVMLLTDGKNEHETGQQLDEVLRRCSGRFVCDARGIGEHWVPEELLRIVSALHGTADAVRADDDLIADFTDMMHAAMRKVVPDLHLQIRTGSFARLGFVKQTYPTENDLTGLGMPVGADTTRFSTGSWGDGEEREYHVCLTVDRGDRVLDQDYQAARVDLVIVAAGGPAQPQCSPVPIRAQWTDNDRLSSAIDPKVAHYTVQTDLGQAVMAGFDAYDLGDLVRAAAEWGRAVKLAVQLGNEKVLTRLKRLVDIVGAPADGMVRLKPGLSARDLLSAAMGSVMSTRSPRYHVEDVAVEGAAAGRKRPCEACGHIARADAKFCENCGHSFGVAG